MIQKRGQFSEMDAAVIIRDVISALQALHERNILHLVIDLHIDHIFSFYGLKYKKDHFAAFLDIFLHFQHLPAKT